MAGEDEDVVGKALAWLGEGRAVALATVVETWGSSPRPRGSQLAVRDDGLFAGSVSGGCVEGRVVEAAQLAMTNGNHCVLEFGVSNDEAWEVGLACGGTVRIHVAPVKARGVLEVVRAARVAQRAVVLFTPLEGGPPETYTPGDAAPAELVDAAARALASDQASTVGSVFVQAFNPALRLIIVGAVHIAIPLTRIATVLGYAVTVIDPREAFARAERWPGVAVITDYPDEALATITVNHRTAIVALTHDPKIDDPALVSVLKGPAFYIGALGSGKTHASRLARLAEQGFGPEALARIHGPIGLRIGAKSPGEIAIAIMAQMTEALRNGSANAS